MKSNSEAGPRPRPCLALLYLPASFVSASRPCPVLPYTNARLLHLGLLVQTAVVSGSSICSSLLERSYLPLSLCLLICCVSFCSLLGIQDSHWVRFPSDGLGVPLAFSFGVPTA